MPVAPIPPPARQHHLAEVLHYTLGLERHVVACTLYRDPADYAQARVQEVRHPLSYCNLVRLASLGRARKTTGAGISCPGALRALGLNPPEPTFFSGERYLGLGLYRDQETASKTSRQVSLLPPETVGIVLQPLAACLDAPHLVLLICSPYQAMRVVQGFIHQHGPTAAMTSLGMQGVCAELTAQPLVSGSINVSLLCSNTRYSCNWEDGEVGVALPYCLLAATVEGICQTLDATEPNGRKRAIVARAAARGIQQEVRYDATYF